MTSINPHGLVKSKPKRKPAGNMKGLMIFGWLFLIGLFAGIGGWFYFSQLSGAVIATGSVSVLGNSKTVQHISGGIVSTINIKNGDFVEEGQILIQLDDTLLMANRQIYANRLQDAIAKKSRLLSERSALSEVMWDFQLLEPFEMKPDEQIKQGQASVFKARRKFLDGQVERLRQSVEQINIQIDGNRALISSKERQLAFLNDELIGLRTLKEQGLTNNQRLLSLERQNEEVLADLESHRSEIARLKNTILESEITILQIDREFQEKVESELAQTENEINELVQQLFVTIEQLKRTDILAPVNGVVHELSIFTKGGVIGAERPIMQIIPQDQTLEIEALVVPRDRSNVAIEQEARLVFTAFNSRTTPSLIGHVTNVSPDTIQNETTGQAFFKVSIGVSKDELAKLDGKKLVPGMQAEVFLQTEMRSAMDYILEPLIEQIRHAMRE